MLLSGLVILACIYLMYTSVGFLLATPVAEWQLIHILNILMLIASIALIVMYGRRFWMQWKKRKVDIEKSLAEEERKRQERRRAIYLASDDTPDELPDDTLSAAEAEAEDTAEGDSADADSTAAIAENAGSSAPSEEEQPQNNEDEK